MVIRNTQLLYIEWDAELGLYQFHCASMVPCGSFFILRITSCRSCWIKTFFIFLCHNVKLSLELALSPAISKHYNLSSRYYLLIFISLSWSCLSIVFGVMKTYKMVLCDIWTIKVNTPHKHNEFGEVRWTFSYSSGEITCTMENNNLFTRSYWKLLY